ncbi:MAG TPA: metal ABC transporter permease [Oligoflexia bacterium]|nr:metal ABC transporter permease [Oligoflexia bacterium]HMP47784.1 metal ABC transporter permease [Oligoflexia bacterium]
MNLYLEYIEYNTLVVFLGTSLLGFSSGVVGAFMLLRRRALLGDVISHSMLPGIVIAILILSSGSLDSIIFANSDGSKYLLVFFAGSLSGGGGLLLFYLVRTFSKLKDDVALSLSLSVFFGFGIVLLSILQQIGGVYASGVEGYLYGKASSLLRQDVYFSFGLALIVTGIVVTLFRPFCLVSFDAPFARFQGYRVSIYDALLYLLILAVCMIGLQAVGVMLMLALLVVPAATMRFWTGRLTFSIWGAGFIGALCSIIGSYISANYADIPSGPAIVLSACCIFMLSVFFGGYQGVLWNIITNWRFVKRMNREHFLRHCFELLEKRKGAHIELSEIDTMGITRAELDKLNTSKGYGNLINLLKSLSKSGLVRYSPDGKCYFTRNGYIEAERLVHQHRLWEMFLVKYADIAPSMVDQRADRIEHVLEPHIIRELEELLKNENQQISIPRSPHPI